jgi:quercetin dioxygenase-like cupin family protein
VERLSFRAEDAVAPPDPRLEGVTIARLVRGAAFDAAVFRIEAGGRVARHPAVARQLLAVLDGSGHVSGGDGVEVAVAAGDAVVWAAGEEHETRSDDGMTALVVEGD